MKTVSIVLAVLHGSTVEIEKGMDMTLDCTGIVTVIVMKQ